MAILMFCSISVHETQITIELSTLTVFCGFRHPGGICIICISKWEVISGSVTPVVPTLPLGPMPSSDLDLLLWVPQTGLSMRETSALAAALEPPY